MIAEIRFKNMFSFRNEAILSFEADRSKDMESYHVVELGGGVRLLKVAVIYGANASGKSNIIKVCDFIKSFITYTPLNKAEQIQVVPFLLNKTSSKQLSEYSISFYLKNEEKAVCYVYSVALDRWHVAKESLIYYPSQQPATIFERNTENNVSVIYDKNGIQSLSINGYYPLELKNEVEVVSPEMVLKALEKYFGNIISDDIYEVQRISLCQKVVHVNPDKHSAEIEPVWECRVLVKNSDLPDSSYLQKIYFHAETLKVM